MVVLAVDGEPAGLLHRSVLDRVAALGERLGCRGAPALGRLPATFGADQIPRLRRDLEQICAFADAARRTGWSLGDIEVAPGDQPVPVLDTPEGRVWVHPSHGFELHGRSGARRITELAAAPGTARRVPLIALMAPLLRAAAEARRLEAYERDSLDGPVSRPR